MSIETKRMCHGCCPPYKVIILPFACSGTVLLFLVEHPLAFFVFIFSSTQRVACWPLVFACYINLQMCWQELFSCNIWVLSCTFSLLLENNIVSGCAMTSPSPIFTTPTPFTSPLPVHFTLPLSLSPYLPSPLFISPLFPLSPSNWMSFTLVLSRMPSAPLLTTASTHQCSPCSRIWGCSPACAFPSLHIIELKSLTLDPCLLEKNGTHSLHSQFRIFNHLLHKSICLIPWDCCLCSHIIPPYHLSSSINLWLTSWNKCITVRWCVFYCFVMSKCNSTIWFMPHLWCSSISSYPTMQWRELQQALGLPHFVC